LVRWLGVSHANMQMGHMRFEPNINLHIRRDGRTHKTPIVEVKNLNSFRALGRTVEFEIERQYGQWLSDPEGYVIEKMDKQNRGYDDATERTVFQREKEEAHDYRYFPDPDLVPVVIDEDWLDRVSASIGELPLARRRRYMSEYGLTFKQADALTQDAATGDLLDEAVKDGADPKRCVNLLLGRAAAIANERGCQIGRLGIRADQLSELAKMLAAGQINATAAEKVLVTMIDDDRNAMQIAQAQGLLAERDTGAIEAWVDEAIAANPQAAEQVRQGGKKSKKAFGFLMGQVMQRSKGTAPPDQVRRMLEQKLGG